MNRRCTVLNRLIAGVSFLALATSCVATTPVPLTAFPTPVIGRGRAIQSATQECRKPHLVLVGELESAKADFMLLSEADKLVRESGEQFGYPKPLSTDVWLVQIEGTFQAIGSPPPAKGTEPTATPPWPGTCLVIVDATDGAALVLRNRRK